MSFLFINVQSTITALLVGLFDVSTVSQQLVKVLHTDELGHSIVYITACAPSNDSNQPAHSHNLIGVLAGQFMGSHRSQSSSSGHRRSGQADLCCAHMNCFRNGYAPAQIMIKLKRFRREEITSANMQTAKA